MCEPVTLSVAAIGLTAASAGVGAYGAIQQGKYASAVANQNAQLAEQAAADALERGANDAGITRMKGSQLEGRQQAVMAANNVDASSGSDANLLGDSRLMNELDVARITSNAAREAWGYKVGAVQARAQGEADSLRAGYGAANSILGGLSQAASIGAKGWASSKGVGAETRTAYRGYGSGVSPAGMGAGDFSISSSVGIG